MDGATGPSPLRIGRPVWPKGFAGPAELLLLALALSVVCSNQTFPAAPFTPNQQTVLLRVPLVKQPYMRCLVASVSMVLGYWGLEISSESIGRQIPSYKDGTSGRDLAAFVEQIGFRGFLLQPRFEDLLDHLEKGRPLIVTLPKGGSSRHAMVLVGFDLSSGVVWLNDPAGGKRRSQALSSFRKQWEQGQRWTFLILPR
jgi:ABC-type bacteriocin/lantibiotic exporter with double-glycine peptidase domain